MANYEFNIGFPYKTFKKSILNQFFYSKLISSNIIIGKEDTWILNRRTLNRLREYSTIETPSKTTIVAKEENIHYFKRNRQSITT